MRPRQVIELSKTKSVAPTQPQEELYIPKVGLLVDRCNHLDEMLSSLRTGSSILMGIGVGIIAWVTTNNLMLESLSIFSNGFVFASALLVICSFLAIILSFSPLIVSIGEKSISVGLLPDDDVTESVYIALLDKAVRTREKTLHNMTFSIGLGVTIALELLMITLLLSLLPNAVILTVDLIHQALLVVTLVSVGIFIFAAIWKFIKWVGIISLGV